MSIRRYIVGSLSGMGIMAMAVLTMAQTRVYIDIDQAKGYLLPIAVPRLLGEDVNPEIAAQLLDVLRQNLDNSGLFRIIDAETYIDNFPQELDHLRYDNWAAIGALGVVAGRLHPSSDASEILIELVLHDVVQQQRLVGKEYRASKTRYREIAHRFSDEVFRAFTGEAGPFNTQVLCIEPRTDGRRGKNIVIMDYDGHGARQLIADGALNLAPMLSPDGTRLAYTSYRDGYPNIYLRALDTREEERITSGHGLALPGSWSQDGRFLLLSQTQDGNSDIFLYEIKRKRMKRLTTYWGIDVSPRFAPDSQRLVFTSDRSGSPQLYLSDVQGRKPVRLTYYGRYNTSPAWSPRDDVIAFAGRAANNMLQIFTIRADGRGLRQLTNGNQPHESPTWAPDGRFLMYINQHGSAWQRHLMREDGQGQRLLGSGHIDCRSPHWVTRITP